ncbi:hypothetical protein ACGTRS_32755 [Burkholderia semiarida]|uniref:MFS transporter n=1 Tax=Burkholderia semiarida TaxID=2843303 RepID=A0ABW7LDT2_9BURK
MSDNSTGPKAPLLFAGAFVLMFTAWAWGGRALTSCAGVEVCATGFAHAAFAAAAYALTVASAVLLIRIAYLYRYRQR